MYIYIYLYLYLFRYFCVYLHFFNILCLCMFCLTVFMSEVCHLCRQAERHLAKNLAALQVRAVRGCPGMLVFLQSAKELLQLWEVTMWHM